MSPDKVTRPMGQAGSGKWLAMLDAAEDILREEGARALTSRRIAERLGEKQRLVYYYFETMDELIVESFKRVSNREILRLRKAVDAAKPLQEVWEVCLHTLDPRLISEFMALANRIDPLRTEVRNFIEQSRRLEVEVLTQALERNPKLTSIPAKALAILGTSVALDIPREKDLGIDLGHAGVVELIAAFLSDADSAVAGDTST